MRWKHDVAVLLGAVAGGVLGHVVFNWFVDQGFYALVIPGGLVGLGAGIIKPRSSWLAVASGLLALGAGLVTEWRFAPFLADESLPYFLAHLHQLKPITQLMIAIGGVIGFWVPFRRSRDTDKEVPEDHDDDGADE